MLALLQAALSDRYGVERELGRGGMASVWLARDLRHDRPIAIKVLHPELAGVIGVDRFIREIRLTARLQHPNIVPVLDSGTFDGPGGTPLPWYAMAYVAGESLRARLDRERQLPVEDALRIAEETASALDAAHREGVIHRDIKPENLLLAAGRTYVADFGIAKALAETGGERLTSSGLVIGTPAYMSPEQATGDVVDGRTDQYSLATVVYEMLAGEPPFVGRTAQAIMARRMSESARPIHPVRPSVPETVEAALRRALERVPADRFPGICDFAGALRSPAFVARSAGPRRSIPAMRAGSLLALIAVVAIAGWLIADRRRLREVPRDPEVVALYQRGMHAFARRTPAGVLEAIQSLTAALRRDSTHAAAWAGLALTYMQAYGRQFSIAGVPRDSVLRLAVSAADRAYALDRHLSNTWVARATVGRQVDPTDVTASVSAARRALSIDSANAQAWHALAANLLDMGDLPGAISGWRRSVAADPTYAEGIAFLALAHYWRRQYDSAAYWADSAVALEPAYLLGRSTVGHVAIERGNFDRARAAFDAAARVTTEIEVVNSLAGASLAEARAGNLKEARQLLQEAESLATKYSPVPLHTAVYIAAAQGALGATRRAVDLLARFPVRRNLHFQLHLRCDPPLDPLRSDPRFQALTTTTDDTPGRGC